MASELLTIASTSMRHDQLRAETIGHNIANVLTPGFKRHLPASASFAALVEAGASSGAGKPLVDFSAGPMRPTGNTSDVAIDGGGFFEVSTDKGTALTRLGSFRSDHLGRLVGAQGWPVLGIGGEIVLGSGPFTISSQGEVRQAGRVMGQLKVVQVADPRRLDVLGSGLFVDRSGSAAVHVPAAVLKPGFLEASNVNSAQEMVRLTETVRHFEAMQKVVQGYDESLEKAVRKLGEF